MYSSQDLHACMPELHDAVDIENNNKVYFQYVCNHLHIANKELFATLGWTHGILDRN